MEVVEFLNCFGLLLSPQRKATKPLSAAEFLQLICPDADGSDKQRLQKFLVSLLRLILTDKISEVTRFFICL